MGVERGLAAPCGTQKEVFHMREGRHFWSLPKAFSETDYAPLAALDRGSPLSLIIVAKRSLLHDQFVGHHYL